MKKSQIQRVTEDLIELVPLGNVFVTMALERMANTILEDEEAYKAQNVNSIFNPTAMIAAAKSYRNLMKNHSYKEQPALNELNHDTD